MKVNVCSEADQSCTYPASIRSVLITQVNIKTCEVMQVRQATFFLIPPHFLLVSGACSLFIPNQVILTTQNLVKLAQLKAFRLALFTI